MPYSENLANKIRQALAHLPDGEEKKMFGKVAFMVDGLAHQAREPNPPPRIP